MATEFPDFDIRMRHRETSELGTLDIRVIENGRPAGLCSTYYGHQSLEYINEAKWRVTLEPEELG